MKNIQFADERGIPHDEVGFTPFRERRVDESVDGDLGRHVRYLFSGHRMYLRGHTVVLRHCLAALIEERFLAIVLENSVAVLDVVKHLDDGLCWDSRSERAKVPLDVANPEDEFG